MVGKACDEGTKIQALTLLSTGLKVAEVSRIVQISVSQLYRLRIKAKNRGWGENIESPLRLEHVADKARSGRPRKQLEPFIGKDTEGQAMREGRLDQSEADGTRRWRQEGWVEAEAVKRDLRDVDGPVNELQLMVFERL